MRIEVSGVRNLAEQGIPFGPGLNLLTGSNGQGKSSVLEAIYLLGTTRSFRTSKLADVVAMGGHAARVSGAGETPGENLAVLISGKERTYLKHGKIVAAAQYIGALDVIALSTEMVHRFRQKPSERRRFLDRMALATYPGYLDDLSAFRRASAQRALLASSGRTGAERKAWDGRAAALAVAVALRRTEMAAALEEHLRAASSAVFPEGKDAHVRLVSRPALRQDVAGAEGRYRDELAAEFAAHQPAPGRRETPAGPARDDLEIEVQGRNLLRYGSSGQIRSLLTAMVLGEMNRLQERKNVFPALVLDDVESDLDEERYFALLSALGAGAQVFAATSKGRLAAAAGGLTARRFRVHEGIVEAA